MGYACPVCAAEQADAEHLANHLAITASLGRQEHQEWLAEHAPEWEECSPPELGEIVAEHAPEIETPSFEEGPRGQRGGAHGHRDGHGHGHGHDHDHTQGRPTGLEADLARQSRQRGRGSMTTETEHVLQEASELTRQMVENASEDEGDSSAGTESNATAEPETDE
ncbi:hypothetical protein C483_07804 [Natrialba hulunbeirensis JCM 10989]|uniref:Uncharacterized protein n=1 Tax=Natrialba hulunbeirensis JCM 10989 TaxID=1227493 RepID=M0A1A1_9EURY|nr:DUF5810 domain-containing protein [Natrialba hulunbeirensis]ELY92510.1 hypothetical protein C483_07804 [Natrialba hulunbeirensis JCM 10989]